VSKPVPTAPNPFRLRITSRSGSVTVIGEPRDDVDVRGADPVVEDDGTIAIDGGSGQVKVRCPEGSDVIVGVASGRVELRGRLGDARVTTKSGSIKVEHSTRLDARSGSGSLEVGECDGPCWLQTGSGSVRVGSAETADLVTASGSVVADRVCGARVKAGSGSVDVGLTRAGDVDVQAHSGSVTITVPRGVHPATRLKAKSGQVRCDFEPGTDGEVAVVTGSGRIVLTEA
jgi:DUF4097 and DUF4098 domain-containing protein YvlB